MLDRAQETFEAHARPDIFDNSSGIKWPTVKRLETSKHMAAENEDAVKTRRVNSDDLLTVIMR